MFGPKTYYKTGEKTSKSQIDPILPMYTPPPLQEEGRGVPEMGTKPLKALKGISGL